MADATLRLFVAGASGATGRVLVKRAQADGLDVVAHYRPKRGAPPDVTRAAVFELGDRAALEEALRGRTTVLQLIGTMRNRFDAGDTYETSDIQTTRDLVAAASATGVSHVILLSSVGAGRAVGAYLKAKAAAERVVTKSGIPFTLFRPSALVGGERQPPLGGLFDAVTRAMHWDSARPIRLEDLSAAMLLCAREQAPLGAVVEGTRLWELVARARA